jgi:2-succinyl-5-enolpyruvyl-6-hydroxy-3-cyclohexene-1-carboxylate synthase
LHQLIDTELPEVKDIAIALVKPKISETELSGLTEIVGRSKKIMVLVGQVNPNPALENALAAFVAKTGSVVLHEYLSNLNNEWFVGSIDALMAAILEENTSDYNPDLLITLGGQFVSKSLKQFLRKSKPAEHWHLSLSAEHFDTYQSLTKVVQAEATDFFELIAGQEIQTSSDYLKLWKDKENRVNQLRDEFVANCEFSDLKAFDLIGKNIPENTVVHLGNSSPVRYSLIHDRVNQAEYYSNRGTAGIDGCLSTAVGFASESDKLNTIIMGDLSFFYDSNALWNKYIGTNLRIIVIHNGGGNIFSMIKGPGETPAFREHFFTENIQKAEGLAKAFGLEYFAATNENELTLALTEFYSPDQKAALLEVFTDAEVNVKVFRELFRKVKG